MDPEEVEEEVEEVEGEVEADDDDVSVDPPGDDEIVAPITYVIEIRDALNTAYYKSLSEDHVQAYRALNTGPFKSRHTNQLEEALRKAEALAKLAEGNEESTG